MAPRLRRRPRRDQGGTGKQNSAAPLLAYHLGGEILLGVISAVAFATILAVVAGLTITASASFAHDIYAQVIKRGAVDADDEVKVARRSAVVIGIVAIIGGIYANGQNIAFLVALARGGREREPADDPLLAVLEEVHHPWCALLDVRRLISSLTLIIFSPVVSGKPADAKDRPLPIDDHQPSGGLPLVPLDNPGLISIPLAFFLGWLGSVTSSEHNAAKYAEMEVRSLTGAGARRRSPSTDVLP